MQHEDLITAIAKFIEYMNQPQNALAIWIAASGLLAGAYLAAPMFAL